MKKCLKTCIISPYIREVKVIEGNNFKWNLNSPLNCHTYNIVYMSECKVPKCKQRYIGERERSIKDRISEHIGYARTKNIDKTTGKQFNLYQATL